MLKLHVDSILMEAMFSQIFDRGPGFCFIKCRKLSEKKTKNQIFQFLR